MSIQSKIIGAVLQLSAARKLDAFIRHLKIAFFLLIVTLGVSLVCMIIISTYFVIQIVKGI
jgi:antibiotic biosynthesis monooxygenase (ABM) superfamily enzyme